MQKWCNQPNRTYKKHVTNNNEKKFTLKVKATIEFKNQSDATTQTSSGVEPTSNNHSNERIHYTCKEQGMTPATVGLNMLIRTLWMIPLLLPDQISVTELKITISTCHQMHPQNTIYSILWVHLMTS